MAKVENTKMTVSLDTESKRIIRHLTRAIDRLSRNMMPHKADGGVTRLMEPADEPHTRGAETTGELDPDSRERYLLNDLNKKQLKKLVYEAQINSARPDVEDAFE